MLKFFKYISALVIFIMAACGEIETYPDTPVINYKEYKLYLTTDDLGNNIVLIELNIEFTDGDGDIGFKPPSVPNLPDSLKYNLFLNFYAFKDGQFELIEDTLNTQNYRMPYIKREGQNKALKGNIYVEIEYQRIIYDTIFYSFYIVDRAFNKSNVDSSDVIILSGINL